MALNVDRGGFPPGLRFRGDGSYAYYVGFGGRRMKVKFIAAGMVFF